MRADTRAQKAKMKRVKSKMSKSAAKKFMKGGGKKKTSGRK